MEFDAPGSAGVEGGLFAGIYTRCKMIFDKTIIFHEAIMSSLFVIPLDQSFYEFQFSAMGQIVTGFCPGIATVNPSIKIPSK